MIKAYYNEFDPFAAQWLRNLIANGHIAQGDVDERSIADVKAEDLEGYTQCHFFAGIGGWSHALRLAGIPDDEPIWTGSCPCQPFSGAGLQLGEADKRHLWPEFRRLIEECRPPVVVGEQVASKLGRGWLAGVRADLEDLGYAVGAADLCAASAGAPHIRQRLWWIADRSADGVADSAGARSFPGAQPGVHRGEEGAGSRHGQPERRDATSRLANTDGGLARHGGLQPGGQHGQQPEDGRSSGVALPDEGQRRPGRPAPGPEERSHVESAGRGAADRLGDTGRPGLRGHTRAVLGAQGEGGGEGRADGCSADVAVAAGATDRLGNAGSGRRPEPVEGMAGSSGSARSERREQADGPARPGGTPDIRLGDAHDAGSQGRRDGSGEGGRPDQRPARPTGQHGGVGNAERQRREVALQQQRDGRKTSSIGQADVAGSTGAPDFWFDYTVIPCTDGKARRVEPLFQPVADGLPESLADLPAEQGFPLTKAFEGRVGALRGIGNAIVPQVAAQFLVAAFDALQEIDDAAG